MNDPIVEIYYHSVFSDIPQDLEFDVVVYDECHHESTSSFQYQLEQLGDFPIIGLTATPDRNDQFLVKFDHFVHPISREQAVTEGYLAETELYSFVDGANKNKTNLVKEMIDLYGDIMEGTMIFMRTKKEVNEITEYLNSNGYKAVAILSQSEAEVNRILDAFSAGEYQFVVNCNKISEGVDVKKCTSVILGRTVGSYPLLNQIIGRAARPDSACRVFEIINPLSGYNLDTTVVVGVPKTHALVHKIGNKWFTEEFDYQTVDQGFDVGGGHQARFSSFA